MSYKIVNYNIVESILLNDNNLKDVYGRVQH